MTMINTPCTTAPRRPVVARKSVLARLVHLHSVWQQRQVLKSLDAAALRDIGVTRDVARAEAKRPIWDAPDTWSR